MYQVTSLNDRQSRMHARSIFPLTSLCLSLFRMEFSHGTILKRLGVRPQITTWLPKPKEESLRGVGTRVGAQTLPTHLAQQGTQKHRMTSVFSRLLVKCFKTCLHSNIQTICEISLETKSKLILQIQMPC